MSQYLEIHATNPQKRLSARAATIVRDGGLVVYPTDSTYAIGCRLTNSAALDRIRSVRKLKANHLFTLVCKDLAELSTYAHVNNVCYRLLRRNTPGPFTFILRATRDVPRKVAGNKRRTIGLRIPDSAIAMSFLEELGEPLLSTSLILPGDEDPQTDPQDIRTKLEHEVDVIIDGGPQGTDPTTLVDLVDEVPQVIRQGLGKLSDQQ